MGRRHWLGAGVAAGAAAAAAGIAGLLCGRRAGGSATPKWLRRGAPRLVAHRGGSGLAPENTMVAFRAAVEDWAADVIELDVRATVDGHCVVCHDSTVDRTTDGSGAVAEKSLEELRWLDAGYHFSPDRGRSFPFRGRGIRIPTLDEVLDALPSTPLIIEVKARAVLPPLFRAIRGARAEPRVILASEAGADWSIPADEYAGPLCASTNDLRRFIVLHKMRLGRLWAPYAELVSVPEFWRGMRVVTPHFIRDMHAHDLPVHVWTVDEEDTMRRLLDWGVDGILTDRPDRLADVLTAGFGRPPPPARRAQKKAAVE